MSSISPKDKMKVKSKFYLKKDQLLAELQNIFLMRKCNLEKKLHIYTYKTGIKMVYMQYLCKIEVQKLRVWEAKSKKKT